LVFLIGGISFTIIRDRTTGRYGVLVLFPIILALLHPEDFARIISAIALSLIIGWIYQKIPDDLDLPTEQAKSESKSVFRFFRGDKAIIPLERELDPQQVGSKAATLSQLKRWGYAVPQGWILPPGDDMQPLVKYLPVSESNPLVVRSSAIGEDAELSSSAGQYQTVLQVTSRPALQEAITQVLASYHHPAARGYRRNRDLPDTAMAVLIQKQIQGVFSGVAFSRDPMQQQQDTVVIEGLPGDASQIVSGQVTPEQYRVYFPESQPVGAGLTDNVPEQTDNSTKPAPLDQQQTGDDCSPSVEIEGDGDLPPALIKGVATLARELEDRYHGIPQDIEWTYDGQQLWLLQTRPITNLQPIWTRKIAAEVIPGLIRPLTWSINRPLTCGVWGEIFTIVLKKRSQGLEFNQTATLHYSRAYFNATLLGDIFRRMGLPPESLEFLTRGAKFSKPPLKSTLRNLPGLLRLLGREWNLDQDFEQDYHHHFAPALRQLQEQSVLELSDAEILERVNQILSELQRATYYSILAPLSLSLRQALLKVKDEELDSSQTPEIASLRSLAQLADDTRHLLSPKQINCDNPASVFTTLSEIPDAQSVLEQFDQFLTQYGYLSDVATDIAVPRWKEDPRPIRQLFAQFLCDPPPATKPPKRQRWKAEVVQARLNLKGRVTEVYSQFLADLRWSFVALEKRWLESGLLAEAGDIFFLEFAEIQRLIAETDQVLREELPRLIHYRRSQLDEHRQLRSVPPLFYGNPPAVSLLMQTQSEPAQQRLVGIGASAGQVEGWVRVLSNLQSVPDIDRQTILVVPYTDSGWAPLLARAGGLIAEVGGRLSHGAIVAREYGIPAVMDIHNATQMFRNGQRVRIDGQSGIVEVLD
jgi:pyruvate,water dikinase